MMGRGKQPTQFEEFDRKTQDLIRIVGEIMEFPYYKNIFSSYEKNMSCLNLFVIMCFLIED